MISIEKYAFFIENENIFRFFSVCGFLIAVPKFLGGPSFYAFNFFLFERVRQGASPTRALFLN